MQAVSEAAASCVTVKEGIVEVHLLGGLLHMLGRALVTGLLSIQCLQSHCSRVLVSLLGEHIW